MSEKRYFTRIDAFSGMDEVFKFWEFAKKRGAKTRKEMTEALAAYKKADIIIEEHKERVEAKIVDACEKGMFKPKEPK